MLCQNNHLTQVRPGWGPGHCKIYSSCHPSSLLSMKPSPQHEGTVLLEECRSGQRVCWWQGNTGNWIFGHLQLVPAGHRVCMVNYKAALAHLPLQWLNHVLLQLLTFHTPPDMSPGVEGARIHTPYALGKAQRTGLKWYCQGILMDKFW